METPHELIELITQNTGNLALLRDRFSDLPEPIILHVFSFLDSNDIARLSYVSRQFMKLCMSCPNLSFELGSESKLRFYSKECTANCEQLQRFLKNFLKLHNASEIHRFRLHWFCNSSRYDAKESTFGMWIQKAIKNKVQELDIGVPVTCNNVYNLPAGIESLKVLKLTLQGGKPELLHSVFASLEVLSLTCVSIPGVEFGEWLCNSCKSLKVLNLKNVGIGKLSISSSSLKVLTVNCCTDKERYKVRKISYFNVVKAQISIHCSSLEKLAIARCVFDSFFLNVSAPSLKDLQISDCETYAYFDVSISAEQLQTLYLTMQSSFCVPSKRECKIYSKNLQSLRKATLSLVPCEPATLSLVPCEPTLRLGNTIFEDFNSNSLVHFIHSVRYAKILQLNFQIIEALTLQDQLPNITFKQLEHFEVTVEHLDNLDEIDELITAIAAFAGCCSTSLKTLTVRCDKNASELYETDRLINQLCSEVEKSGANCGNMKITCSVISN